MPPRRSYLFRIRKSLKDRGFLRTIKLLFGERRLDWKYHTGTAGIVNLDELDIQSPNKDYGYRYEAINPVVFRSLMKQLPLNVSTSTFCDLGCGKGAALMLAAEAGFGNVIGVEFARTLCKACEDNLHRFNSARDRPVPYQVVHQDAATYEIPAEVDVLFLFDPFGERVLDAVVDNLETSLQRHPRTVWVVYPNAVHHELFARRGYETVYRQLENSLKIYIQGGSSIYRRGRPLTEVWVNAPC